MISKFVNIKTIIKLVLENISDCISSNSGYCTMEFTQKGKFLISLNVIIAQRLDLL